MRDWPSHVRRLIGRLLETGSFDSAQRRVRALVGRRHRFEDVAEELIRGLEDGSIQLEGNAMESNRPRHFRDEPPPAHPGFGPGVASASSLAVEAARRPAPPRRNEPCPCGSGKMYKRCCRK